MKRRIWRIAAFSAPFLIVGVAVYAITILAFGESGILKANPKGPPPEPERKAFRDALDRQITDDEQKPRFTGVVGDFLIVPDKASAAPNRICLEENHGADRVLETGFVASELNKPRMTEQVVCEDGTAVATYSDTGRRSYFTDRPRIAADAPIDRIQTVDVDGHQALVIAPPSDYGVFFIHVIQREPGPGTLGIFVSASAPGSLDKAVEAARAALSN